MSAIGSVFGHKVYFGGEIGSDGRWLHRDSKGRFTTNKNLKCPKYVKK